jgi:MFS family permease
MASTMSLIAHNFPDSKDKYISHVGTALGIGLFLGPPIGSYVYGWYSYSKVFYLFSMIILITLIM